MGGTRSRKLGGRKDSLEGYKQPLNLYDVRQCFAENPTRCVSHDAAKDVLRAHEHPVRGWIKLPKERLRCVNDQLIPWWRSLRDHLSDILPSEVVDRFADYLSGFMLVLENETLRSTTLRGSNKKSNGDWRQLKKLLSQLRDSTDDLPLIMPVSVAPPQQESLKTKLIGAMSKELADLDYSHKIIADRFLPPVWDAIGENILTSSFLRSERRSRKRTVHSK